MTIEQTPRALSQPQTVLFVCPPCKQRFPGFAALVTHWYEAHERWSITPEAAR
jgi:hypothetical protein